MIAPTPLGLFHSEFDWCFVCFCNRAERRRGWSWFEVQHIERKSHAKRSPIRDLRCNLMLTCKQCHDGPLATMEHAKQLAYRHFSDPWAYETLADMIAEWHTIRAGGRVASSVTEFDVAVHLGPLMRGKAEGVVGVEQYNRVKNAYLLWRSGQ